MNVSKSRSVDRNNEAGIDGETITVQQIRKADMLKS